MLDGKRVGGYEVVVRVFVMVDDCEGERVFLFVVFDVEDYFFIVDRV